MRIGFLVLAACGSSAASSVTISYQVPPAGARWTHHREQSSDLSGPALGAMHDDLTIDESIEVLAASADQVTKEKVTYTHVAGNQAVGGAAVVKPTPIDGKTYVLELVSGALAVSAEDGSAVPPDEEAQIEKLEHDFVRGDRAQRAISGQSFTLGKAVDFTGDQVKAMLADDDLDQASMSLTFTGMKDGLARFTLSASMSGTTARGVHTDTTLGGDVAFDPRNGRVGEEHLSGPMTLTAPIQATGTMTISESTAKP